MKNIQVETWHRGNGNAKMEMLFKHRVQQIMNAYENADRDGIQAHVAVIVTSDDDGGEVTIKVDCDDKKYKEALEKIAAVFTENL